MWRPSAFLRASFTVYAVLSGGLALMFVWAFFFASTPPGAEPLGLGLAAAVVTGAALFGLFCVRMARIRFTADGHGVEIRNLFGPTRTFTWDRIARFHVGPPVGRLAVADRIRLGRDLTPAYAGIWMELSDGTAARLNAIQKSNLRHRMDVRSNADDAVSDLNRLIEHLHGVTGAG